MDAISLALAKDYTDNAKAETNTALAQKANLSIFVGMTQAEYDALETKTEPLYFIYEDEEDETS